MKDVFTERIAARRAIVIVGSMLLLVASDMPAQTAEEHASHHRDADEVTHLQETGNRAIEDLATGKTQDIDQVMKHAGANDHVKLLVQVSNAFDRQLSRLEVRQVVLLLQCLSVFQTRRAHVNAGHTRSRMTERKLCGLKSSTAGHEHVEVSAVFPVGPHQVKLAAVDVLALPQKTHLIQVRHRRRIRVIGVELTKWIGACIGCTRLGGAFRRFCFHKFFAKRGS